MRLATFNLLHGRSVTDGLVDPGRLTAAVSRLDADVICLQEVDRGQPRSGGLDLTRLVAQALGCVDGNWRFAPALIGEPGGVWRAATDADDSDVDSPAYGIGLVSRLPVRSWHLVRLSAARVRSPVVLPGSRRVAWLTDEPRLGLAAVVESASGPLTVASTHLSFVPLWNAVQLRRLVAELAGLPAPQVLLGDLNLPGPFPGWLSGWQPLATDKTYPAWRPSIQIDHALGHGALPRVVSTEAPQLPLSDHRALIIEFADPQPGRDRVS